MKPKLKDIITENPQDKDEKSNRYLKRLAEIADTSKKSVASAYRRMVQAGMVEPLMNLAVNQMSDVELIERNVRYKKETQRHLDTNRIERKSFREHARIENCIEAYSEALLDVFKKNPIQIKTIQHETKIKSVGVIQLTDTHFNELVEIQGNQYDFTIASKRIQKFIEKAKHYFYGCGIETVLFALTGDLLNSDRRLDELLSEATNRSKATFLAVQIIENAIIDINIDFNVIIASVVGNESRITKDIGWSSAVASDNYDLTIYRILEYHMKGLDGIEFCGGDELTKVVEIAGYNWLLIHGHQSGFNTDPQKVISKLVRLYSDKGIAIRYVIFGHIHEALIADMYSRGSSTVGSNAYSENGLMLTSRASQNVHIQWENGDIDSVKFDLQNVDGYEGYPIQKELEAYNAKSASKARTNEVIFKVVI